MNGDSFTLSGPIRSQWKTLVHAFFEFRLRGKGGGAGMLRGGGPASWAGDSGTAGGG